VEYDLTLESGSATNLVLGSHLIKREHF
jgi:hypothetical protein